MQVLLTPGRGRAKLRPRDVAFACGGVGGARPARPQGVRATPDTPLLASAKRNLLMTIDVSFLVYRPHEHPPRLHAAVAIWILPGKSLKEDILGIQHLSVDLQGIQRHVRFVFIMAVVDHGMKPPRLYLPAWVKRAGCCR